MSIDYMSQAERRQRAGHIRQRYTAGESAESIARSVDLGIAHVMHICSDLRREQKVGRYARIRARVKSGQHRAEVAADEGLSMSTVEKICQGLPGDDRRFVMPSAYGVIADLINTVKSQVEIAADRRVSRQRVQQIYQKCVAHGIPVKRTDYAQAVPRD